MARTSAAMWLICSLAGGAAAAQTGQIHGVVTDPDGKPLVNVTVTLVGPTMSGRPTTTDERGEFRFMQLAPGRYTVWADEHGPRVAWRGIGVRVGVTSRVALTVRTDSSENQCAADAEPDSLFDEDEAPQEVPAATPKRPPKATPEPPDASVL